MPLVNGLGFLYRLRSRPDYRDVPVAIVTGDRVTNDELLADVRALGARLVFKPVWRNALIELARTLLTSTAEEAAKQWTGKFNPKPFHAAAALEIYQSAY